MHIVFPPLPLCPSCRAPSKPSIVRCPYLFSLCAGGTPCACAAEPPSAPFTHFSVRPANGAQQLPVKRLKAGPWGGAPLSRQACRLPSALGLAQSRTLAGQIWSTCLHQQDNMKTRLSPTFLQHSPFGAHHSTLSCARRVRGCPGLKARLHPSCFASRSTDYDRDFSKLLDSSILQQLEDLPRATSAPPHLQDRLQTVRMESLGWRPACMPSAFP